MNTITIIRESVKLVGGMGAGAIVANACKRFTPENMNVLYKVFYGLGAIGIGCVVIEATDNYWNRLFNEIENLIKVLKSSNENTEEMEKELIKLQKEVEKEIKKQEKETKKNSKKTSKKEETMEA